MKSKYISVLIVALLTLSGCKRQNDTQTPACQGAIWIVQWTDQSGSSQVMARAPVPELGVRGSVSWNMDLYGRLYSTHLEIINNKKKHLGPMIIPLVRIDYIQFGEGEPIIKATKK